MGRALRAPQGSVPLRGAPRPQSRPWSHWQIAPRLHQREYRARRLFRIFWGLSCNQCLVGQSPVRLRDQRIDSIAFACGSQIIPPSGLGEIAIKVLPADPVVDTVDLTL